jgi:hypothetical protein
MKSEKIKKRREIEQIKGGEVHTWTLNKLNVEWVSSQYPPLTKDREHMQVASTTAQGTEPQPMLQQLLASRWRGYFEKKELKNLR